MDRGIIAKIKGFLRKKYSKWVCDLTVQQLGDGVEISKIKVPSDVPTCRKNLFVWLSESVDHFNTPEQKAGVVHCWKETNLLRAWEPTVQMEAFAKLAEILPNMEAPQVVSVEQVQDILGAMEEPAPQVGDSEAHETHEGAPFLEGGYDEEWMEWCAWED